jgi:hypothetical protein
MQYSKFAVDENPWCVWDWNLEELNLTFIKSIEPTYFEYLAKAYVSSSTEEQEQNAALALRTAYSHGLETFFAFLFATIQAPDCVIGWVHKYEISHIKSLVNKINNWHAILTKLEIRPMTWENIANTILLFSLDDKEKEKRIKLNFSSTWRRFAYDFLKPSFLYEYNGIKHGFRAKSGGFWLAFGVEKSPGVPVPPDQMQLLGKSDFGSTFYTTESLDKVKKNKLHFRLLKHSTNWSPEKFYLGLHILSLSLQNVLSYLKIVNGLEPSSVEFAWPDNEAHFQDMWNSQPNVSETSMNSLISPDHIIQFTKEEILSVYEISSSNKE